MDSSDNKPGFFARLKQHHIYRVVTVYAIAAWVLMQLANSLFPDLGWPRQSVLILIVAVALLFPVVLILSWMLIPPSKENPDKFSRWQHLRWKLGSVLTLVIVVLVTVSGALLWHAHTRHLKMDGVAATTASTVTPGPAVTAIPAKSIAVLPFENLSADKNNAYFADGMQDLILTKLADIGDLKVIARTSTEKYKSHPDDLKTIAQQLGVATILEGSVQKSGNQVLINVQLIDANTNAHLWAEAYTRTLDNIFDVEGEVAQKVANALDAKLTTAETQRVSAIPTQNPQAWNLFLQGEYYGNQAFASELASDFDKAIQNYRAATEQDPKFALAWARLALAQLTQTRFLNGDTSPQLFASAKRATVTALKLAPDLAEAYLAQGFYDDFANHDLDAALVAFETARKLKPQDAEVLLAIGLNHKHRDQWDAAIQTYKQVLELDPRNLSTLIELALAYQAERRWSDAERIATQGLAIDPESATLLEYLASITLEQTSRPDRALAVLDAVPASVQGDPILFMQRAYFMYLQRDYGAVRAILERMPRNGGVPTASVETSWGNLEWRSGNLPSARTHFLRAATLYEAVIKGDTSSFDSILAARLQLGWIYARLGSKREALEQGRLAINSVRNHQDIYYPFVWAGMAEIQAELGDAGAAVALLDRVLSTPNTGLVQSVADLRLDPDWDPIRNDPRFQALLKKYGSTGPSPAPAATSGSAIEQE